MTLLVHQRTVGHTGALDGGLIYFVKIKISGWAGMFMV
jgi:hypothetical protein